MIIYQTENLGNRLEYRSNPHENYVVPPHIHEYSELALTKSGVTAITLMGKRYLLPPNHLILILPNQVHEYSGETASQMRCAVFSGDHIPVFFEKIRGLELIDPVLDLSDHTELLDALDRVAPTDTLRICGLLNLIADLALKRCKWQAATHAPAAALCDVIRYISQHFCEDLTLSELAKRSGYHEKYLSSALHAITGMHFRAFLASYRINLAKSLLCAGGALAAVRTAGPFIFAQFERFEKIPGRLRRKEGFLQVK